MYATDFQFDNEMASSHGLMVCTFGSAGDIETISNGADITLTTTRVPGSNVWHHVNAQYQEVLTTTFQIAKKQCGMEIYQSPYFTVQEQEAVNRWLNRIDNYYPFRIVQEGFENIYFNVQINVKKIEIGGKVAGFEVIVTSDKPYGYFEKQKMNFQLTSSKKYSFLDMSDDIGTEDTEIEVTCVADGDLQISNSLTGQTMIIKGCTAKEVINIDTSRRKITSSIRTNAALLKDFNFVWLTVGNTRNDRLNTITSSLPVTMCLVYNPVCKVSF